MRSSETRPSKIAIRHAHPPNAAQPRTSSSFRDGDSSRSANNATVVILHDFYAFSKGNNPTLLKLREKTRAEQGPTMPLLELHHDNDKIA